MHVELDEAWIEGDRVRLDQIVCNLVINAVKYTPEGGNITVRTRRVGGECILTVADDGVGMSPDLAQRAFDLFVQGDRGLDRAQGGLGIGLTLVRRLAELHHGRADLRSDGENRGSEFTVRFPAIEKPALPEPVERRHYGSSRTVLLVEDNEDARDSLHMLLATMGHQVEVASDGLTGLEKALALAPDVALVDLGLPGMDGYELARRIRPPAATALSWSR
jgi:anti-sigma regulatory factor (Ser/Thr protein kinase)